MSAGAVQQLILRRLPGTMYCADSPSISQGLCNLVRRQSTHIQLSQRPAYRGYSPPPASFLQLRPKQLGEHPDRLPLSALCNAALPQTCIPSYGIAQYREIELNGDSDGLVRAVRC